MLRRIVLVRRHEPLEISWQKKSFKPAGSLLERIIKVTGMQFDERYHPVRVTGRIAAPEGVVPLKRIQSSPSLPGKGWPSASPWLFFQVKGTERPYNAIKLK